MFIIALCLMCASLYIWVFPGGGSRSMAVGGQSTGVVFGLCGFVCVYRGSGVGLCEGRGGKLVASFDRFFSPLMDFKSKDWHQS